jgi:hypothetical protein
MEKLRLKIGDYELEVEGEQAFIEKQLAAFDQRIAVLTPKKEPLSEAPRKTAQPQPFSGVILKTNATRRRYENASGAGFIPS